MLLLVHDRENAPRLKVASNVGVNDGTATLASRVMVVSGATLHPDAVRVMADAGVDIAGNSTKHLRVFTRTRFDRIITLCDKVREVCPDFAGSPTAAHWSIPDPAAGGGGDAETLPAFERVAADLEVRIPRLIARISAHAGQSVGGEGHKILSAQAASHILDIRI